MLIHRAHQAHVHCRRVRVLEKHLGGLLRTEEECRALGLYPRWADRVFGRSLPFLARLGVPARVPSSS